jgi:hypothetical protein
LDVEEGVLKDGSKTSKDYNFQREHDHVLVKDVDDDCVPDGGDTRCWVVLLSCPSFYFSYFCRFELAFWPFRFFGDLFEVGSKIRQGVRWATDGDIKANGGVGTCVVDLRWGGLVWVERNVKGLFVWV